MYCTCDACEWEGARARGAAKTQVQVGDVQTARALAWTHETEARKRTAAAGVHLEVQVLAVP